MILLSITINKFVISQYTRYQVYSMGKKIPVLQSQQLYFIMIYLFFSEKNMVFLKKINFKYTHKYLYFNE